MGLEVKDSDPDVAGGPQKVPKHTESILGFLNTFTATSLSKLSERVPFGTPKGPCPPGV